LLIVSLLIVSALSLYIQNHFNFFSFTLFFPSSYLFLFTDTGTGTGRTEERRRADNLFLRNGGLHPSASTFFPSTRLTTIPPSIRRETSKPLSFFSFFLFLVAGKTAAAEAADAAPAVVVVNVEVDDDSIIVDGEFRWFI